MPFDPPSASDWRVLDAPVNRMESGGTSETSETIETIETIETVETNETVEISAAGDALGRRSRMRGDAMCRRRNMAYPID